MSLSTSLLKALVFREALRCVPSAFAADYIKVPWSSKLYGPDGPWQAVQITVGGTREDILLINEDHTSVDLLPGGEWNSKILTTKACEPYKDDGNCGAGGMWDPEAGPSVDAKVDWLDEASGIEAKQQGILLQATTTEDPGISYWNTSLMIVEDVAVMGLDGRKRGPELGRFALGGPEQVQRFATDSIRSNVPLLGFTFGGAAFNKSKTRSFSYGLQIGSAAHGYTGSLIIGGYDKGRLIGPYTSFNDGTSLLGISIGVETGGSPFDFEQRDNLLISNTSQVSNSMPILPDPQAPYLHLPGKTCEEIAKHIPVKFDTNLKYWLWKMDDPQYSAIITSPAYLGFTFPPATGKSGNVTIKVPFQLLNLTLDKPIVDKPTSYFPCVDYVPTGSNRYVLGRAFLQAAFLGRNWNGRVSWLGQAPGPGVSKVGLGESMLDLQDSALELPEVFDNQDLFAQSWGPYWTALPGGEKSTEPSPSSTPGPTPSPKSSELSPGAKAGIGLGAAAVALLAIGVFILFRRRKRPQVAPNDPPEYVDAPQKAPAPPCELENPPQEMNGGVSYYTYELPSGTPEMGQMSPPPQSMRQRRLS